MYNYLTGMMRSDFDSEWKCGAVRLSFIIGCKEQESHGGITLEDCATVSDQLSEALDNADPDPIPQAYFLEVSSPGAERPLKKESDYQRALNEYIHVSLYQAVDGRKVYEGTMTDLTPDSLTLDYLDKTRHKTITLDRKKIAKARLAIKF